MKWVLDLNECLEKPEVFSVLTVVATSGSVPREVGAKMIVRQDGTHSGTIGGGHLEALAVNDALMCIRAQKSQLFSYPLGAKAGQCCGGKVDIFVEVLNSGPLLYVFGAGHVGHAVSQTLIGTAFRTTLIDSRPEWIQSKNIPPEIGRVDDDWDDFVDSALWDENRTFAVIMTHEHRLDQDILEVLLKKPMRYLGLIGSEKKWATFKSRLLARGFSEEELARVHCPIGLPLGGKSPKEVAISFAAEVLTEWNP